MKDTQHSSFHIMYLNLGKASESIQTRFTLNMVDLVLVTGRLFGITVAPIQQSCMIVRGKKRLGRVTNDK